MAYKSKILNYDGFFSLYFILFLSLLTSFMFSYGFIFYASQSKDTFRTACATNAVEIQKNLIRAEKSLFLLNIPSSLLRLKLIATYAALASTPAPYNAPLLAELHIIQLEQKNLELLQQKIIQSSQMQANFQYGKMIAQTNQNNSQINSHWSFYLNIFSFIRAAHAPQLSVQPDSIGGTAPNYELQADYQSTQRVELIWQNWFTISDVAQKFFNPKNFNNHNMTLRYGFNCRIEPERTNNGWDIKIRMDKL
jgi:hypothetical protein